MPIWKVIRPRAASSGRPRYGRTPAPGTLSTAGYLPGRAGHAQDPVQPARASRQPDVLQVDLRALHVGGAVIGKRRPLRVERQRRQPRALRLPERIEVRRIHLCRLDALRREAGGARRRDRCGRRLPRSRSVAGSPDTFIVPPATVSGVAPTTAVGLRHRGQHLRPDAILHRRAGSLVAVAHAHRCGTSPARRADRSSSRDRASRPRRRG